MSNQSHLACSQCMQIWKGHQRTGERIIAPRRGTALSPAYDGCNRSPDWCSAPTPGTGKLKGAENIADFRR